jgi:hypothetical protein
MQEGGDASGGKDSCRVISQLCEGLGLPTLAAASFVTSGLQRESAMASREFARVDRGKKFGNQPPQGSGR